MWAIFGCGYKVWVVNTTIETNLYLWPNWQKLLPYVDQILKVSKEKAFIRTQQAFQQENRWLGFGRMKWNEENNKKWTTKYRTPEFADQKLTFYDTEIWAPDWNICYKTSRPPEIFVHLYHHQGVPKIREGLLIAIRNNLAKKNQNLIEQNMDEIVGLVQGASLSMISRSWMPGWRFPNRIEDINNVELEKIVYGTSNT
ncbi:MAG: hypothetical protein AAF391_04110 [Bacteroidota bacterium]